MGTQNSVLTVCRTFGFGARLFANDRRGVAAIEFLLVVPLLFALYFLILETAQAIDTNKKVSRVASMVGDLVAQQQTMSPEELDAIMKIGQSILQPYNRSSPKIVVSAIEVTNDNTPKVRVAWSRELNGGEGSAGVPQGTPTEVPEALRTKGSFYIRASAELNYRPMLVWSDKSKKAINLEAMTNLELLTMGERYYLMPRQSTAIPCEDCS